MHPKIIDKTVVRYSDDVTTYFNKLITTLFWQDYFGFIESAYKYIADMKDYIEANIAILPKYKAPSYFSKYQTGMMLFFLKSASKIALFPIVFRLYTSKNAKLINGARKQLKTHEN